MLIIVTSLVPSLQFVWSIPRHSLSAADCSWGGGGGGGGGDDDVAGNQRTLLSRIAVL